MNVFDSSSDAINYLKNNTPRIFSNIRLEIDHRFPRLLTLNEKTEYKDNKFQGIVPRNGDVLEEFSINSFKDCEIKRISLRNGNEIFYTRNFDNIHYKVKEYTISFPEKNGIPIIQLSFSDIYVLIEYHNTFDESKTEFVTECPTINYKYVLLDNDTRRLLTQNAVLFKSPNGNDLIVYNQYITLS